MVLSCGNPVQPAVKADERRGGAADVPGAVQQPAPAAQRPSVGEMGDRLLDQRAQSSLQAVERPLGVAEAVLGAAVADRCVPVLTHLGQPAESPIQQAGDLDIVEDPLQPCQFDELVLVAAARPATVAPQQVAVDGRDGKTPGRCERAAWRRTRPSGWPIRRVAAPGWPARPPRPPRRRGSSPQASGAGHPGWQSRSRQAGSTPAQQADQATGPCCRQPRSWRSRPPGRRAGTTARPGGPRRRRPGAPPATAAGCRPGQADALGAGGPGDRPARPVRVRAARSAGSMTRGPDLQAGLRTLPMVWPPSTARTHRHHGHPQ
jgi:hypothetical protein